MLLIDAIKEILAEGPLNQKDLTARFKEATGAGWKTLAVCRRHTPASIGSVNGGFKTTLGHTVGCLRIPGKKRNGAERVERKQG